MYRLNLLLKEKKHQLQQEYLVRSCNSLLSILLAVSVIATLALYGVSFLLQNALRAQEQKTQSIVAVTLQQQGELPQDRIRQINTLITRGAAVQKDHIALLPIYARLEELFPSGITLLSVDVGPQNAVTVAGTASSRQDLLTMEKNFTAAKDFTNVASPVTNLLERVNIPFTISATFLPS